MGCEVNNVYPFVFFVSFVVIFEDLRDWCCPGRAAQERLKP